MVTNELIKSTFIALASGLISAGIVSFINYNFNKHKYRFEKIFEKRVEILEQLNNKLWNLYDQMNIMYFNPKFDKKSKEYKNELKIYENIANNLRDYRHRIKFFFDSDFNNKIKDIDLNFYKAYNELKDINGDLNKNYKFKCIDIIFGDIPKQFEFLHEELGNQMEIKNFKRLGK